MPINSFLYPGAKVTTAYEVANSCRFDDGSSDYLNNTSVSTVTSRFTFTISLWVKRSTLGAKSMIGTVGGDSTNFGAIWFDSSDRLNCTEGSGGGTLNFITNRLFRDVSAWYHIVLAIDTTQSTESNRVKIYVNGVQETSFSTSTYPPQNSNMHLNRNGKTQYIGRHTDSTNNYYFDGYITEVVWVDGQQLSNTDLGEFDSDSPNIWKPIDVSGLTFGNNGFYLDFENSGSLGADVSGNSNNFTVNNLTSIDQSTDTCTNNFATWNPLDTGRTYTGTIDLKNGNLTQDNSNDASLISTIALNSGKWYMEFKCEDADNTRTFGIIDIAESNGYVGHPSIASAVSYGYKSSDGTLWIGTSQQASSVGTTSAGDIVSIALDLDSSTKTIKWQKNGSDLSGTTQLTITHSTATYYFGIYCRCDGGQIISANFGSPPYSISSGNSDGNSYGNFEYAVPSGYYALNTKNLAEFG